MLQDRLHDARVKLRIAYEQRDALVARADAPGGRKDAIDSALLIELAAAERSVREAEADMIDAQNAVSLAIEAVTRKP
ncbi:MAG: hypothetical protein K2X84_04825 [Beijerinckiaceae bacterium]|nr:hypothetical protein [Beijerinckiaceae bacterium]